MILAWLVACTVEDGQILGSAEKLRSEGAVLHDVTYASDGLKIQGFLVQPTGAGPYPVVMFNHGGFAGMSDDLAARLLERAALHKVVISASMYRGEGTSEGEIEYCLGEVTDSLNLLLAADGFAETNGRIAAFGPSHGACVSLMANAQHGEFLGTVAQGAPTEVGELIAHHYAQNDPKSAAVWDDYVDPPAREVSPLYANLVEPVALLHGERDELVPVSQACLLRDASEWPVANLRYTSIGLAAAAQVTDDCQVQSDGGTFADHPEARDRGLTLAVYEGAAHQSTESQWDAAFTLLSGWLR